MTLEERIKLMLEEAEQTVEVKTEVETVVEAKTVIETKVEPELETVVAVDEISKPTVSAQVSAILEAEGLSEEFKLQAVTIFEAAVADRVLQIEESLKAEYEQRLDETKHDIEANIDGFLSEAVREWQNDNKVEIESNFKSKLNESFIDGLQALLAEHNLELVAGKEDALDVALSQVTDLEEANAAIESEKLALVEEINSLKSAAILESYRAKMPSTTFDRFVTLTESIAFASEQQYAKQLDIVFTNFTKTPIVESVAEVIETPTIVAESVETNVMHYANYFSSKK